MVWVSLLADLKVFYIIRQSVVGKPHLLTNQWKVSRNDSALRLGASSRCTAVVEAQVNKNTSMLTCIERSSKVNSCACKGRIICYSYTQQIRHVHWRVGMTINPLTNNTVTYHIPNCFPSFNIQNSWQIVVDSLFSLEREVNQPQLKWQRIQLEPLH